MTVGDLRKLIRDVPDAAPVLCPGRDHSYREAAAGVTTALCHGHEWTEDYGEESTPEADYGKRVLVVVIG